MRKRLLTLLLAFPLLATFSGVPVARAQVADPCALQRIDGESTPHFMKRLIRCAVDTFGPLPGDAARAICIADRESNLQPKATSATGEYLGIYQHAKAYWPDRYARWDETGWTLKDDALNGRANIVIAVRMVAAAGSWKAAGWPADGC